MSFTMVGRQTKKNVYSTHKKRMKDRQTDKKKYPRKVILPLLYIKGYPSYTNIALITYAACHKRIFSISITHLLAVNMRKCNERLVLYGCVCDFMPGWQSCKRAFTVRWDTQHIYANGRPLLPLRHRNYV